MLIMVVDQPVKKINLMLHSLESEMSEMKRKHHKEVGEVNRRIDQFKFKDILGKVYQAREMKTGRIQTSTAKGTG